MSGGFTSITQAKTFHGLLVLSQAKNFKYNENGEMRVSINELHRLTRKACIKWDDYLKTMKELEEVQLDWGHLSRLYDFNRAGLVRIVSESRADLDLAGQAMDIVFRIPAALLNDVIRPSLYGQVDPSILFSLRSNYAFNAYLHAGMVVIHKDSKKSVFHSHARPISEWKEIMGADEAMPAYRFRTNVFRRVEKQIDKATHNTEEPIEMEFTDIDCEKGLYQMCVKRLARPKTKREKVAEKNKSQREQCEKIRQKTLEEERQKYDEQERIAREWYLNHPEKDKIDEELNRRGMTEGVTIFSLLQAGYDPPTS